jgi:hypothetical protein
MKKHLMSALSVIALMVSSDSNAQSWQWASGNDCSSSVPSSSGYNFNHGTNITIGVDGSVYSAGTFTGDFRLAPGVDYSTPSTWALDSISRRMFIVKYDSSGTYQWSKGTYTDETYPMALASDNSGNLYAMGSFRGDTLKIGPDVITSTDTFHYHYFLIKYSSTGTTIWAKNLGVYDEYGHLGFSTGGAVCDEAGNLYISGSSSSKLTNIGGKTVANNGNADIFIAKLNSSGYTVWVKSFGGTGSDCPSSLKISGDNLYLAGAFRSSSITFGPGIILSNTAVLPYSGYASCAFLVNLNTNGGVLWARSSSKWAVPNCMDIDNSGNIYIGGALEDSTVSFGPVSLNGIKSAFVVRYSPSGNPLWGTTFHTPDGYTTAYGLCVDGYNNIWVSGGWHDNSTYDWGKIYFGNDIYGEPPYSSSGCTTPGYMVQLSPGGNPMNYTLIPSAGGHPVLASDPNGNVYITSSMFETSYYLGTHEVKPCIGFSDSYFTAKYKVSNTATISVTNVNSSSSFNVYPNPANDNVTIHMEGISKNATVVLSDVAGRILSTVDFNGTSVDLPTATLNPGLYHCRIMTDGIEVYVEKIVVTH